MYITEQAAMAVHDYFRQNSSSILTEYGENKYSGAGTWLDDYIKEVNDEHDDDITCQYVRRDNFFVGKKFLIDYFPAVVIWPTNDDSQEITTGTVEGLTEITVYIVDVVDIGDESDMSKKLWRYLDAIERTLFDKTDSDFTLNNTVDKIDYIGREFNNPWLAVLEDRNAYVDAAGVKIRIHKEVAL